MKDGLEYNPSSPYDFYDRPGMSQSNIGLGGPGADIRAQGRSGGGAQNRAISLRIKALINSGQSKMFASHLDLAVPPPPPPPPPRE
ncbi:hypothetical protein J6590_049901 [Homalodisca vitripennis]|nr:hypothetical protein J6590_049901 [Homalodisca vitripennis]